MNEGPMTKSEQFLWIVQTTILANGVHLASVPELAEKYLGEYSAGGTLINIKEAVRAADLIPEEMNAFDAANDFCFYMLKNLRDNEEESAGTKMTVPAWFARTDVGDGTDY